MKLSELKNTLLERPEAHVRFVLPEGDQIPAHFHITEVGHVAKRFIDCGGLLHDTSDTCLLQTHVGDDVEHRLTAGRFVKILGLGVKVLPHDELETEVEYDCCVVSQYRIAAATFTGTHFEFQLSEKQTACLANERAASEACACC